MNTVITIIEWIIVLFLAVIFLKSSLVKLRNPYLFYLILIKDYKFKLPYIDKLFVPLIIILELMISIWIFFPHSREYGAAIGLILQLLFITIMILNYGKVFRYGCGCFEVNFPKKITIKKISFNLTLLFCFFTIFYF